jgi:PAS domain S-box-containing protein
LIGIADYMLIGSQAAGQVLNEHLETQLNANQQQQAVLLEAQGVLKAIYEHSATGIVILDSDGFVRGVNPAALDLLKVDISRPYLNVPLSSYNITWSLYLVDGTLVTMETYPLTRALKGEIIVDEIERVVRWDNSERWISTNASPIYSTDNTIMGATIIFTDITDSYLSIQKLQSSRDLTTAIVSQSPVPTMVIRLPNLTTELINNAAKELLGIQDEPDREDVPMTEILRTKSWLDLNPDGSHVEPAELPLAQALRGKKVLNRELWIRRKDNTERWALFNGIPLYDINGKQIAAMLIFPDITSAKHAETEVNDWKKRYEMVTQSAEQVVYDYDIPNDYLSWNNVTLPLLGFAPEELNGPINKWVELIHPDDMAEISRQFEESERLVTTFDVEYRFRRKDGQYLWVHDRGLYFAGPGNKAVRMVGVMQDITRHKLADAEQARL